MINKGAALRQNTSPTPTEENIVQYRVSLVKQNLSLSNRAQMNRVTDDATACIPTPASIRSAPPNTVARRPNLSEHEGAKGRPFAST